MRHCMEHWYDFNMSYKTGGLSEICGNEEKNML